jgi:hypothetical protein
MAGYWTHLAANADPNIVAAPVWSPYDSNTDESQALIPPAPTVNPNFSSDHLCTSLWDFI